MATAECYDDVQGLETPAVRELLANGTPPQRVWAVWTLALRSAVGTAGPRGLAELAGHLEREPDPGVRRTLAVVLASHGEYDLLLALANGDPEPLVRASAMQVVARVAAGGAIPEAVVRAAARIDTATRIAILGAVGPGSPPFLVGIADAALADDDQAVRLEALEALLRTASPAADLRARAFIERIDRPETFLDAAGRWIRIAGVVSCARGVAGAPVHLRAALLRQLREPTWSVAEVLIGNDRQLLATALSRNDIAMPARVLAGAILLGMHRGFVERLTTQLAAAARARQLHEAVRAAVDASPAPDAIAIHRLLELARRCAAALEVPDADQVLGEIALAHPVEQLLGLEHAVERWVAMGAPPELASVLRDVRAYGAAQLAAADPPAAAPPNVAQLALGDGDYDPRPRRWDGRAHFTDLLRAIDALLGETGQRSP